MSEHLPAILLPLVGLAIIAMIARWAWRMLVPAKGRPMVCTACGHHGATKPHTRGSMGMEIVLWLLFLVPGLIYSVWRVSTRTQVCASCGGTSLVPAESPLGAKLLKDTPTSAAGNFVRPV